MDTAKLKNEVFWLRLEIELAKINGYDKIVAEKTAQLERILYILGV